ncbi:MAG: hypothetical protein M3N52_11435 [Actinomycetota bacterium]|nr:hypothetical protein [Actinomycetota bacterium]
MSTTLLSSTTNRTPSPDLRRLARALLEDHADAGAHVADLVERADSATWSAAQPWVASLAAQGRRLAGELARLGGTGAAEQALSGPDAPRIVWAREIGVSQRMVLQALDAIQPGPDQDQAVSVLIDGARRMHSVVTVLARISATMS